MVKEVLFLFETTNYASKPFQDKGYRTISIDIQNEDNGDNILNWDILKREDDIVKHCTNVVLVVGFPPCTDLAVSGAAHFAKKRAKNPKFQDEALDLFLSVERIANKLSAKQGFRVPWMAENPISVVATMYRKPNFKFQPYEYGGYLPINDLHPDYPEHFPPRDAYTKCTCIWSGNDFKMPIPYPVPLIKGASIGQQLGGKSAKTKRIRSSSPRGFFTGLANQW